MTRLPSREAHDPSSTTIEPFSAQESTTRLRVALVNMPYASVEWPSIQCGLLKSLLLRDGHSVDVNYVNLQFAKHIGLKVYEELAEKRWLSFLGEWLFAGEAFGKRGGYSEYFEIVRQLDADNLALFSMDDLVRMREQVVPAFIDALLDDVSWSSYDVVGLTCTFDQKVPSFALARRLKERYPNVKTVFGGATFDEQNASEFMRKLPWIDYIITGEADNSFPLLLQHLATGDAPREIPGLVYRSMEGDVKAEPPEILRSVSSLPDPDYDEYFETLKALGNGTFSSHIPKLPFQSARGCWWGAKHHCTFCSLKDSEMLYRSRTPELVASELKRQASKYRQLYFTAADSILDMRYIDALFPLIEGIDATFFYEVKANLTRPQIAKLASAHVKHVQPGIESLSTHALELMKKGTTKLLNIRLLKWVRFYGIYASWNILAGFPGETLEDYTSQTELIPWLLHLQPPHSIDFIMLEKHAPYVENDNPWFRNRRPAASYQYLFPGDVLDLNQVAQYFDSEPDYGAGIPEALENLKSAVQRWREAWRSPQKPALVYQRGPDWGQVIDTRDGKSPRKHRLDRLESKVMELCEETPVSLANIVSALSAMAGGISRNIVYSICDGLISRHLMVEENERYFSLAMPMP